MSAESWAFHESDFPEVVLPDNEMTYDHDRQLGMDTDEEAEDDSMGSKPEVKNSLQKKSPSPSKRGPKVEGTVASKSRVRGRSRNVPKIAHSASAEPHREHRKVHPDPPRPHGYHVRQSSTLHTSTALDRSDSVRGNFIR